MATTRKRPSVTAGVLAVTTTVAVPPLAGPAPTGAAAEGARPASPGSDTVLANGQVATRRSERGDVAASFVEGGGRSGANRLTHWADRPYRVRTYQRITWPDGRWDNWDRLAALLAAGSTAVTDASPRTKVVLRLWHGPLGYLQANLVDRAQRHRRPVMVVETAYGFTLAEHDRETNIFNAELRAAGGYPASQGQAAAVRDMVNTVAAVPGALGVFYWKPTWTAVAGAGWDPAGPTSGDGWENQAMFDYSGRALPALRVLGDAARR